MIKIKALNEAGSDDNDDYYANVLTKEAQEQLALNEYNKALKLLVENKKSEALSVLEELLSTELIDNVRKSPLRDSRSGPMLFLKYSCYKNVANIHADLKNYQNAIDNYWEAANLDDTDVMLWFKIGNMAVKISNFELGCFAFIEGLKRNNNHWPCLDKVISLLFAIPDYMSCLLYISVALEKDPTYVKGLTLYKKIFSEIPALEDCYKSYNSNWSVDLSFKIQNDQVNSIVYLNESNIHHKWKHLLKKENTDSNLGYLSLRKSLTEYSWFELGKCLLDMYSYIIENNLNFSSCIALTNSELSKSMSPDAKNKDCNTKSQQIEKVTLENQVNESSNLDSVTSENSFELSQQNSNSMNYEITDKTKLLNSIKTNEESNNDQTPDFHVKEQTNVDNFICYNEKQNFDVNETKNEKGIGESTENLKRKLDDKLSENDESSSVEKEKGNKVKKRRRSSLCFLTQWAWSNNSVKRSSRARVAGRKDYEKDGIELEDSLRQIFPPNLLPDNIKFTKEEFLKNDDSLDAMDIYYLISNKESNITDDLKSVESSKPSSPMNENQSKYFETELENFDVNKFIKDHTTKNNIMLIIKFLEFISTKWYFKWPDDLVEVYIQLYLHVRQHIKLSSIFGEHNDEEYELNAHAVLLFCELCTDKWISTNQDESSESNVNKLGIGVPSDELGFIVFCKTDNIQKEADVDFLIRLLWLKANLFLYQDDLEISLNTFRLLLFHMKELKLDNEFTLKLVNCKYNSTINMKNVQKMLTSIQRSKKLCHIKSMYEEKKYEEIASILKETFYFQKELNLFMLTKHMPVDRVKNLQILLECLWHLRQFEDCYVWAEACLNESWQNYLVTINSYASDEERNKWLESVLYTLEKLYECVSEASIIVIKYLTDDRRSRLVQNLVHILCHQLNTLEKTSLMPVKTILPWILLHYILQYEEDKRRAKSSISQRNIKNPAILEMNDDEDDESIPASIIILFKAHKFLGRHGVCCMDEGRLLIFIMKSVVPKLHFPSYSFIRQKLKEPLEQIIYCLYGYPSKFVNGVKTKPKFLEDHTKSQIRQIDLTWDTSQLLFEFYKPENFPTLESKRTDSINVDTVVLFKEICKLIPQDSDPIGIVNEMDSYLLGQKKNIPSVKKPLNNPISYIYYMIADHYFKTTNWPEAIKYYTLDLCLHHNELNSWAGLAMSTSTEMETWLNNFQPNINEEKYLTKAKIAQQSYQHAVELDPSYLTIWTEYGGFTYTVHSFCSRLLKQESDSLSMEKFEILETQKEEMLDEAKKCFVSANNIYMACQGIDEPQDERWLYQYMLAKIAEKKNEDPPVFLEHYSKANLLLYQNNAQYPKRISHKSPPNLAIEAIEVYYRIHASILKYLEQHEGKQLKRSLALILERNLKNCMQSPFMSYTSTFKDLVNEEENNCTKKKLVHNSTSNVNEKSLVHMKSTEISEASIDVCKLDNRKRSYVSESDTVDDVKKSKFDGNYSHLELMQDVVALTDELITKVCEKVEQAKQATIDGTINQEIANKRKKEQLTLEKDSAKKLDAKRLQNKDMQCQNSDDPKRNSKDSWCRRNSQESTTTTQTSSSDSNCSSSSSSEESSTSDDSSDSSSSSDSDSDSNESDAGKNKVLPSEDDFFTEEETRKLIDYCITGLEQCVLRFPEHYKAIYRLAHFFFHNKFAKNIYKCKELLLGKYTCQFHPKKSIQGLFSERKSSNFFNGIWRIPNPEIDRPGSFASHMSKCILLLMQVLKETGDSQMLTELCIQLRKVPDVDKKYLRDNERKQLSEQALTLCLQCLRNKITNMNVHKMPIKSHHVYAENSKVLLDIYNTYQQLKNIQEYEAIELPKIRKLLEDAYLLFVDDPRIQGNIFDLAKEFCRQRIRASKITPVGSDTSIATPITNMTPLASNSNMTSTVPSSTFANRKLQKTHVSGKSRGRPPGVNNFRPFLPSNSKTVNDLLNIGQSAAMTPTTAAAAAYLSNANNSSNNPFCTNPFLQTNSFLASMLGASFGANMIDTMNYLNSQTEIYQDFLRQYKNASIMNSNVNVNSNVSVNSNVNVNSNANVNSSANVTSNANVSSNANVTSNVNVSSSINVNSNINVNSSVNVNSNINKRAPNDITDKQPAKPVNVGSYNINTIKERPDISITPVVGNTMDMKSNSGKSLGTSDNRNDNSPLTIQLSKSVQITPTTQYSAYKPLIQQQKAPIQQQKPQISQQKSQIAQQKPQIQPHKPLAQQQHKPTIQQHKSPVQQHKPLMQQHPLLNNEISLMNVNLPANRAAEQHISQASIMPMPMKSTYCSNKEKELSLQHKLKKQAERSQQSSVTINLAKRPKESKGISSNAYASNFNCMKNEFPSFDSIPMHVQPQPSAAYGKTSNLQKPAKLKAVNTRLLTNPMQNDNVSTLSMLSQLQQNSHLEIIPQTKNLKSNMNIGRSTKTQNLPDPVTNLDAKSVSIYEMPKHKADTKFPAASQTKKQDGSGKSAVEIITLDD